MSRTRKLIYRREQTIMAYNTVIDGTEDDDFTLTGSGQHAPFYLFDINKQDWTHGPYPYRWIAFLHLIVLRFTGR